MSSLVILVWKNREGTGEPEVEARIPTSLAKWVPRMMKFVPKKTKEETWGDDIDFDGMFADLEKLVNEATAEGQSELMTVKAKDAYIKITVEK